MPRTGGLYLFLSIGFALNALVMSGSVQATTYYVDQHHPSASDNNKGTRAAPWLTLQAIDRTRLLPGDTVLVAKGVYRANTTDDKVKAILPVTQSGKSGRPIVIRSNPMHAAVLQGDARLLAAIQVQGQSHITIEGFTIINPGYSAMDVSGEAGKPSQGITLRNNQITLDRTISAFNGFSAIRVAYARDIIIEQNRIENKSEQRWHDSMAIGLTHGEKVKIEANEIENLQNGILLNRSAGQTQIIRNVIAHATQAVTILSAANQSVRDSQIAHNVFNNVDMVISLSPDGGLIRKTEINNNVFHGYRVSAMQVMQPGMGRIEVWNNMFKRASTKDFIADVLTYDDPPLSIARMDYNWFDQEPLFITGLYTRNRRLDKLNAWQDFAEQDSHSNVAALVFRDSTKNDFRLAKGQRKAVTGTVDGTPASKRVDVGVYAAGVRHVGRQTPTIKGQDEVPQVQVAQKTESTPTQEPKQDEKPSAAPVQDKLAMVTDTPAVKTPEVKVSKLEWEVEKPLQFQGKCVLESNRIDFYDGYDNTGLKFRVMNNQLYLLTKSNIDMSFHDVGLQIGKNDFLHADEVVQDQNVVINKELPKMLTQLRKSGEARVQLRFWPTYPATKPYSQVVALDGFLPAYKAYKDCQGGQ